MSENIKHYVDWTNIGVVVASVMGMLPAIAAGLSIIWTGIRIYEWYRGKFKDE